MLFSPKQDPATAAEGGDFAQGLVWKSCAVNSTQQKIYDPSRNKPQVLGVLLPYTELLAEIVNFFCLNFLC